MNWLNQVNKVFCHREEPVGRRGDPGPNDLSGLLRRFAPRNDRKKTFFNKLFNKLFLIITILFIFFISPSGVFAVNLDSGTFPGKAKFKFQASILDQSSETNIVRALKLVKSVDRRLSKRPLDSSQLKSSVRSIKNRSGDRSRLNKSRNLLTDLLAYSVDKYPKAYYLRGTTFLFLGDFPGALADFYSAMIWDKENNQAAHGAYATLIYMWPLLTESQKDSWADQVAGQMGERLFEIGNGEANDYLLPAKLFYKTKQYDKSLILCEMGLKKWPEDRELFIGRLMSLNKLGADKNQLMEELKLRNN